MFCVCVSMQDNQFRKTDRLVRRFLVVFCDWMRGGSGKRLLAVFSICLWLCLRQADERFLLISANG